MKEKLISTLHIFVNHREISWETGIAFVIRSFSKIQRVVFFIFAFLMATSVLGMLWYINQAFLVPVPAHGGTLIEGAIRSPVLINPLFANSERASEVDRDLTALIYSGLLRANSDGTLSPDLAERYDISPDGLTYTFFLKEDMYWHDGKPISADDVVFTIAKAQDSILKSPKRASWDGVIVEEVSARTVRFILENPYPPFLENMTLGILPKHIWNSIDSSQFEYNRYNREPIGSGPYMLSNIVRDANDVPLYYDLIAFDKFALGKPFIDNISIKFYSNEETLLKALRSGEIQSTVYITPETAKNLSAEGFRVDKTPLLHIFGIFFNQNQKSYFTDKTVRTALHDTVDKERIIREVFYGYATPVDGPLPPGTLGYTPYEASTIPFEERIADAQALLIEDGWKYDDEKQIMTKKVKNVTQELSFSISTISPSVIPALKSAVAIIKENWEQLGARVDVKIFETKGDLSQNAIRPRKYDALLFGEVIGRDSDPFAFWHSSQRLDPGLNIALYANIKADKALEEGRTSSEPGIRAETYETFTEIVRDDVPAVFIYSPDLMYVLPKNIGNVMIGHVVTPSERFAGVHTWYLEKVRVWKMYTQ